MEKVIYLNELSVEQFMSLCAVMDAICESREFSFYD